MKTIVFDLDGTLIDISKRDYQVYADLLIGNGYIPLSFDIYWAQRRQRTDIHIILEQSGCDVTYVDTVFLPERSKRIERLDYLKLDRLFDGVKDMLSCIASLQFHCVLVTMRKNSEDTIRQLNWLQLSHFFSDIYIVKKDKEEIFAKIGNIAYVVGDTENDILPARKLNIPTIGVTTGIRSKELLEELDPSYIVAENSEILTII